MFNVLLNKSLSKLKLFNDNRNNKATKMVSLVQGKITVWVKITVWLLIGHICHHSSKE